MSITETECTLFPRKYFYEFPRAFILSSRQSICSSAFYLIFVCVCAGGQLNSSQVWRFMAQLNQWVAVGSLMKGRWRHKMVSLCGKVGSIIIHHILFFVLFPIGCSYLHWVCLCLQLYAVGGFDGQQRLNSVECFTVFENVWKPVAPLLLPVSSAALASCSGKLYVISGAVSDNCNTNMVRLQTCMDMWDVERSSYHKWLFGVV